MGISAFVSSSSVPPTRAHGRPPATDLHGALLDGINPIKLDRSKQNILCELLPKLDLDPCVPIGPRTLAGKMVRAIGAGTVIAYPGVTVAREAAEPSAFGLTNQYGELAPAGESTVVFRGNAFSDDATFARANLTTILKWRVARAWHDGEACDSQNLTERIYAAAPLLQKPTYRRGGL